MKKTLFIIAACALAAVSCQKEMAFDNEINSEGILTVTADIAQFGADTKTSIDGTAETIKPLWSADDSIKLFNKSGEVFVYVVKSTDVGKSSAEFEPKEAAKTFTGEFACAYYPAGNATAYTDGTGITANIPSQQAYVAASGENAGTFANGAFPMVGTGTLNTEGKNLNLTFKNVFGLVQLNFTGTETIKQIELVSSQMLSGVATIATDGTCTLTEGGNFVDLTTTAETQPTLDGTAKAFYIAVPADSTVSKIYVTTTSTSTRPLFKVKDITVSRSRIASLASSTLSGAGFAQVAEYQEATDKFPVVVAGSVWAPVNCGYDATNAPTGLFYQWARKYGQSNTKTMTDADFITTQVTTMAEGNTEENKDKFYKVSGKSCWYTQYTKNDTWLSEYDPCPAGWRVPTVAELTSLNISSTWVEGKDITGKGSGSYSGRLFPASGGSQIFLPIAGGRDRDGSIYNADMGGLYWSSSPDSIYPHYAGSLDFKSYEANIGGFKRSYGYSVRCVQE